MKSRFLTVRTALAGSLGICCCFGTGATHAQSSVTLGGILDTGLLYANNAGGHAQWTTASGQLSSSRWILTGQEDLGGGTRAVFRLMSPFNIDNGHGPGRAFNVSYVGLTNDGYGTLTLGRQWDSTIDFVSGFASNETWAGYIGAHVGDADNTNATFKVSNTVKYASPTFAGFSFGATYGFSNQPGDFTGNRLIAAGAGWTQGPVSLGVGFVQADRPDTQPAGALGAPGAGIFDDYSNTFSNSLAGGAGVQRQRIWLAGASWHVGTVTLAGLYSKTQYRYLDATALTLDNYEASVTWQMTPTWLAGVAYIRTNGQYSGEGTAGAEPGWDQLNLGTQYQLSKRTTLYLIGVGQQGRHAQAQIYGVSPSSTRRQLVVTAGMAHRF
ncbi:porin [Paraburkholderia sp. Ac-20340]|uniref:porin n=1 Tax=Paraburkholderia sp. Ac-20340 TaxID=2703888 RepID=UPI00198180AF|nr:porin [Paraburkholderia sp. Ac-20340]